MLFGLSWRVWAVLVPAALLLLAGAFFFGARQAWDSRGQLEAAERAAEIAQANEKAETLRANLNTEASELAETTRRLERAIEAAGDIGAEEINHAALSADADALYAAWARARERVWSDAGFAADPAGGNSSAREPAPAVRGADNAAV